MSIYGPYIEGSATSFEYTVPTEEEIKNRIREYQATHEWLVYEIEGKVVGYAYASPHRARAAYQWSTEVSAYIHPEFHRKGIAKALYKELFASLINRGYHLALAGITLPNPASIALHESLGFELIGTYKNIGYKMGNWHDVGWWQLELKSPIKTPTQLK